MWKGPLKLEKCLIKFKGIKGQPSNGANNPDEPRQWANLTNTPPEGQQGLGKPDFVVPRINLGELYTTSPQMVVYVGKSPPATLSQVGEKI